MVFVIGNVLNQIELDAVNQTASDLRFLDGKATAGRFARDVKNNQQAVGSDALEGVLNKVKSALGSNEVFTSLARPRGFARLILSRYSDGMAYGSHVDDAIMAGARTDLSFTLFMSDPETYEGGGLVIEDPSEERLFRPQAGDAVLYATSALHRVQPVTRGARLAVVGWVQSWVRDPAQREVLHDLDVSAAAVFEAGGKSDTFDRLLKAKTNLFRMWADG